MNKFNEVATLAVSLAVMITMILIFIGIWIAGVVHVGEDNTLIRVAETILFLYAAISLSVMLYRRVK